MKKFINSIKKQFSKVKFYDRTLWKSYASFIAFVSTILTIISFFFSKDDMIVPSIVLFLVFLVILFLVFIKYWYDANKLKDVDLKINNTNVEVIEGDIFDSLNKPEKHKDEVTVIAANSGFDTVVDDKTVAKKTLHGQYINRIEKQNKLEDLILKIENDEFLNRFKIKQSVKDKIIDPKVKYELGSMVEFENYIITAFVDYDKENKAFLSADEYMHFWMKFWENIDTIYAGRTINIPLIGAGITRFRDGKPSKQQLLEMMLWTLKISGFHNTYANRKIKFIIYKDDIPEIDFYHIKHNVNFK